ncbi:MAG TPA: hypothetical protein VF705_14040, partial [Longimicrobium sp.]
VSGGEVWATWDDRRAPDAPLSLARVGERPTHPATQGRSPALAAANGRVVLAWLDRGTVRVRER